MLFGAHLSISGGYDKALSSIAKIGGNCLQIFSASPRSWGKLSTSAEQVDNFLKLKNRLRIHPVVFHASYLINLADTDRIGNLSVQTLTGELHLASKMKIMGSIVHLGSYKGDKTFQKESGLIKNIHDILAQTPKDTHFIIENAGTRKIGRKIEEIAEIIKSTGKEYRPRMKVCLDTCHLFAAGYDFTTKEKLDKFLQKFDKLIGLDSLAVIHLNDSKDDFGALRDRHDNIGDGKIGLDAFRCLLNHLDLKHLPFIIETPGFEGQGPDRKNLEILKSLI